MRWSKTPFSNGIRWSVASVILCGALVAQTPVLSRVLPEAASPGDLVILVGTNLANTNDVTFVAAVGGFAGVHTIHQPVVSVSATQVRVLMPTVGNFLPPNVQGSSPIGSIAVRTVGGVTSAPLTFYFMEQTAGRVHTAGIGTTQANPGQGRPVISFPPTSAPIAGNTASIIRVANGTVGLQADLVIGTPIATPFIAVGDGLVAIDVLGAPFFAVTAPVPVDALGDASLTFNIPPSASGLTVALQWATSTTGFLFISNGLVVTL